MLPILRTAKGAVERMTGLRIYRNGLPHGASVALDIDKRYGIENVKIIFDVGANIGQSALAYVQDFPRAEVYSFEPVSGTFAQLRANTQHLARIHPFQLAMGSKPGQAVIHVNELSVKSSILQDRAGDRAETIQVETVAAFADRQNIPSVDFLKIDTEGFDLEVLAGAAPLLEQQRIHLVLSECQILPRTNYFVSIGKLAEYLQGFGYELLGIYEQQPNWSGENILSYCNALFVCPKLSEKGGRLNSQPNRSAALA
jgi:FkbM family methyltransferase